MSIRVWTIATLLLFASVAQAANLEEVIVTAERADEWDGSIPAVAIQRRADFIVQRVRLVNDTRAADGRADELRETIRFMVADAARQRGMSLGHGTGYFLPIDAAAKELTPEKAGGRADTDQMDIFVKVAVAPDDDVGKAVAALFAFIEGARVSGRTEVLPLGDVSLSIVAPEQYRDEIVGKIARDLQTLGARLGGHCRMEVSGLERRVHWERSGLAELTLYIPYEARATDCGERTAGRDEQPGG